jgi:tetratricopeptide (TPR) repeat protein
MLCRALSGEIAMGSERSGDAVLEFEQAVRIQDALIFNEPPDWPQSMRLYLGAALLKAGRSKDAEANYTEELRGFRDNGWALFGLWQSVLAQGRKAEAKEIRERFDRAWKNADVVLSSSVF